MMIRVMMDGGGDAGDDDNGDGDGGGGDGGVAVMMITLIIT